MAKLPTVRYIWTAEDQRIAGGDTAGSVQGAYVTPYGIPAAGIAKCATFTPGAEVEVDLGRSGWGEPWRATRFCHGKPLYEWHKPGEIPGAVTTLAELCKYLRERDPNVYPDTIYGDKRLADLTGPDNPAKMLFDYWQNSRYRYGTVKEGFDWGTYARDPGSIRIRSDGGAIEYVLRKIVPLPKAAAAPGAQKRLIDEPSLLVEHYISEVTDSAANIRMLLKTSETVMRERYQIIYRLQALRAIAEASTTNPEAGMASQGPEIVRLVDVVLPRAHRLLVAQPITSGTEAQRALELFKSRRELTMDAVAELRAEQQRLRGLLLESSAHAQMLKVWAVSYHAGLLQGQPRIKELLDRLTATLAEGHLALGECGTAGDDDVLFALLDKMREGHAEKPEDIDGESPTEVVLSLVGKGTSLATTVVGNLAGPPSLSIAMLQVSAMLRFTRLAKESLAQLNAIPSGIITSAIQVEKWKLLADRLVEHLADGEVKDEVKLALLMQDRKKLADLKLNVGETVAGSAQQTVPWKGAMVILGLLSTILAIREATTAADKSAPLVALDFLSNATAVASVSLGTYETFMTVVGRIEDVAKMLTKAGNSVGLLGAFLGAISGGIAWHEAYGKADGYGMVSSMFGVVGSLGMIAVAASSMAGLTMPVVATIALACLLASGAVSVAQILEALDSATTKTNRVCLSIIRSVRNDVLGQFIERSDATILFAMDDLERLAKESFLPNAKNDYFVVTRLAKAGLSEEVIREIVNSSAIATTMLGPGLGPRALAL
ncbi:uncharacterized protein SOCE26_082760 [Sorangium cellulosum]|uniref:Uncharacterized protein n=1 Tax=Sorangium cellulosum TaxID=56 RepID=A0A2L0F5G2_SORCE|nr:hypothetical protein [Sorangium cellulosum]AUX46767.1 uncharacterized protein SOCE26_082760 [Sorangium cellulosum]